MLVTFGGGVLNTGTVASTQTAVVIKVSNFSGGVDNKGTVSSNLKDAIEILATSFSGGITNSGSINAPGIWLGVVK